MNSNVTPFLLIALSIGIFYAYINPHYAKVTDLRAEAAQYTDALDQAKQIQQVRDTLLAKYNSFSQDDLNKLNTMLPDSVDNVKFVFDIATVAAKHGISVKDIKVEQSVDDQQSFDQNSNVKKYGSVKVTFSFVSTYDDYIKFTQDLEQSLRIVDMQNITFKPSTTAGTYDSTLSVNTYWLKK